MTNLSKPEISNAGLGFSKSVIGFDETGAERQLELVGERALTLYVDKQEIVTLMTMGTHPELLTLGYLKNQGFFECIDELKIVQVDWETEAVAVVTKKQTADFSKQMEQRTVTTGCGQGTVFGRLLDKLKNITVPTLLIKQSTIYALLNSLRSHNEVYKKAGAVHGCALCSGSEIDFFIEDVGRHNAVDKVIGKLIALNTLSDAKILTVSGRISYEIVIKCFKAKIPFLAAVSAPSSLAVDYAKELGITLFAFCRDKRATCYSNVQRTKKNSQNSKTD